jgi:hypothetical protein
MQSTCKAHVVPCNRACSAARRTAASWLWPTSSPGAGLTECAAKRGAAGPRRRQKLPSGACGGPFWASAGSPPSGLKITSPLDSEAAQCAARAPPPSLSLSLTWPCGTARDEAPAQLRASSRAAPATEPEMPSGCPGPLSGSQGRRAARDFSRLLGGA